MFNKKQKIVIKFNENGSSVSGRMSPKGLMQAIIHLAILLSQSAGSEQVAEDLTGIADKLKKGELNEK